MLLSPYISTIIVVFPESLSQRMNPWAILPLYGFLTSISALGVTRFTEFDIANVACLNAIMTTATVCSDYGSNVVLLPECMCVLEIGFTSFSNCLLRGYGAAMVPSFLQYCAEYTNVSMSQDAFWKTYNDSQALLQRAEDIPDFNFLELLKVPILLEHSYIELFANGFGIYLSNFNWSLFYGMGILAYWFAVLLFAAIVNWSIWFFPKITDGFSGPLSGLFRRYISLSATIRRKKATELRIGIIEGLIPSRIETILVLGWVILVSIAQAAQIRNIPNNPAFTNQWQGIARMVGDRSGITCCFMFPLLVLFAARNNVLQWITRWNFATFVMYHRWISRVTMLLVLIHGLAFTVSDVITNNYTSRMTQGLMKWGTLACISGMLMLFQGMLFFRRRWYEVFLGLHIFLAIMVLFGAWYHAGGLGYGVFFWIAVGLWILDWLIRIARIVAFGTPMATVTLMADETLRVVIPKPAHWKCVPGGHAFLYFMQPLCFWQSHPFTFTDSPVEKNSIVLYLKVKGGITNRIYNNLLFCPGNSAKIRICVEGPYGEPSGARKYQNAVFIAGGNGIPGIYSECVDLERRHTERRNLKLVWVVREWKSISWFHYELKRLESTSIQTTVYVTSGGSGSSSTFGNVVSRVESTVSSMGDSKEVSSSSEQASYCDFLELIRELLPHVTFIEGRPSMEELVRGEIADSEGSIAFVSCGHPRMVDDLRYAVVHNLERSRHRVDFFEQLQVWA